MKMQIAPKRMITAGGTLVCALGIGYFMQSDANPTTATKASVAMAGMGAGADTSGSAMPDDVSPVLVTPEDAPKSDATPHVVELSEVALTSAIPELPSSQAPSDPPIVDTALQSDPTDGSMTEQSSNNEICSHDLIATPEAAAMVRLSLSAPCMANEQFTLHHNGMMFSHATDEAGQSNFVAPALSENAVFIIAFANGEGAVASAEVTSFEMYDRAVVQWRGNTGLQIHAREYGAAYGNEGHVWAASAQSTERAALGEGGFLSQHGVAELDSPLLAEVYTFPTGVIAQQGDVTLSVEAEVTAGNCGRDVEAQSIQKQPDGTLKTQDLVLAMPECAAVGDFLVLKNLLNDLKIAAK